MYVCLSLVEEVLYCDKFLGPHALHVYNGMHVLVFLEDVLEKRAAGDKNYFVSVYLRAILAGQGHIREVLVISHISEG